MSKINRKRCFWIIAICIIPLISLISMNVEFARAASSRPFVFSTYYEPQTMDPHNSVDDASKKILFQSLEGLFAFNLSSSELEVIPRLASSLGVWSPDHKNLTIPLRTGVSFHDGTPFNSTAVQWNFDRILHLMFDLDNLSSSFRFKINNQWILNRCVTIDTYTVRFVLNYPNTAWESILADVNTFIFKPDVSYWDTEIPVENIPVGTGPFVLDSITVGEKLEFSYNPMYYRGWGTDHIENLEIHIKTHYAEISRSFIDYESDIVDYISSSYYSDIDINPDLTRERIKSDIVYHLQMNALRMPLEVRLASQFVWNYSYFLDDTLSGNHFELHSPIPEGISHSHGDETFVNSSYDGYWAHLNVTRAREMILSCPELAANISSSGLTIDSPSTDWVNVAESTTPLAWYNFTRYESALVEVCALLLQGYLKEIGIKLTILDAITWQDWIMFIDNPDNHKCLAYSFNGWGPDYPDPLTYIEPLFQTGGDSNSFELSDSYLDSLINRSFEATGTVKRDLLYELQEYFVSEVVPNFYILQLGTNLYYNSYRLSNVEPLNNAMGIYYFYPLQYGKYYPPDAPVLNSITPNPSSDGNVHITWSSAPGATDYKVYRYSSLITEVNSSVVYEGKTSNTYWDDTFSYNGTWYYAVFAINGSGSSEISNSISVEIAIPPPDPPVLSPLQSPNTDGVIELDWNDVPTVYYYYVYRYHLPITEYNYSLNYRGYTYSSSFTDSAPEGLHYYAIRTYTYSGYLAMSNTESVLVDLIDPDTPILEEIATPDEDGNFILNWNDVDGAVSYYLYESDTFISDAEEAWLFTSTSASSYEITNHDSGTYYFAVTAVGMGGHSNISNCVGIYIGSGPFIHPIMPNPDDDGLVYVNWNEHGGADSYSLYRYSSLITEINSSVLLVASGIIGDFYTDTDVPNGEQYYVVVAICSGYETPISNCVSVTVEVPRKIPGFQIGVIFIALLSSIAFLTWKYKTQK